MTDRADVGKEDGEIVEAVIVFPVFLLLLLTMFQFAFLMLGHEDVEAASQYGAQVAATSGSLPGGLQASQELLANLGGTLVTSSDETGVGTTPEVVAVTSEATVQSIVAIPGIHLSTNATSVASVQRLSPAGE